MLKKIWTNESNVIKNCKAIVGYFKPRVKASKKLRKMQKQMGFLEMKVKQDVRTKWNSSLIMMERLIRIKELLSAETTYLAKVRIFLNAEEWDTFYKLVKSAST